MRNVIAHNYEDLQTETIWQTAEKDVPKLLEQIRAILKERF